MTANAPDPPRRTATPSPPRLLKRHAGGDARGAWSSDEFGTLLGDPEGPRQARPGHRRARRRRTLRMAPVDGGGGTDPRVSGRPPSSRPVPASRRTSSIRGDPGRSGGVPAPPGPARRPGRRAREARSGSAGAAQPPARAGRITSVFSTKGGLGVTTLATNLAVCLAERTSDGAVLIDLDTRQSDVATFLDLRHDVFGARRARQPRAAGRAPSCRDFSSSMPAGSWSSPGRRASSGASSLPSRVQAALEIIRSHFGHVVLDLRHDIDPGTIAALEASDTILYLTSLDRIRPPLGRRRPRRPPPSGPQPAARQGRRHARRDRGGRDPQAR